MRVVKRIELLQKLEKQVDELTSNYNLIEMKLTEVEQKLDGAEDSASELKDTVKKTTTGTTTKKVTAKKVNKQ